MSTHEKPMGVLAAERETRLAQLESWIKLNSVSNELNDYTPDWKPCTVSGEWAEVDCDFTFLCDIPASLIDGVTTDELETAIDDALCDVAKRYLREIAPEVIILAVDVDSYATLRHLPSGLQIMYTLRCDATLGR